MSLPPHSAKSTLATPSPLLLALAISLPVLMVAAVLWHTFVSLPMLDDYDVTLGFLLREQHLHTASAKLLTAIAEQQSEYKFLLLHLLLLGQHSLIGHLSLAPLAIAGNLLLLPVLYTLIANAFPASNLAPRSHRLILSLPILYLSCQLTYAEVFNWALVSWNALAVVAFATLALHFLCRRGSACLLSACLSLMLACAASTNGFLLLPIGLLLLVLGRRPRAGIAWCAAAALSLALFLFHFHKTPHDAPPPLHDRFLFFLSFLGGAVENMHRQPVRGAALLLGLLLLLVVAEALRTGFLRRNPFFVALATWVVLSAAAVANFRASIGLFQSLSGRYKLYSTLLLVFSYVYLADRIRHSSALTAARRRSLYLAALTGAVLFNVAGTLTGAGFLLRRQHTVIRGMQAYLADPVRNSPLDNQNSDTWTPEWADRDRQILSAVIADRIYTPDLATPAK